MNLKLIRSAFVDPQKCLPIRTRNEGQIRLACHERRVHLQQIIDEALGVASSAHDVTDDGIVNVVDVQIVMNAALYLGCTVPQ